MSSPYTVYILDNSYTLAVPTSLNSSMPMYDKTILLYSGTDNKIYFNLVNSDNKPYDLTDQSAYFNMTDIETNETLLAKQLTITDMTRGKTTTTVLTDELYTIAPGFYHFSSYVQDSAGAKILVHTDRAGDAVGVVEVKGDPFPIARPTQVANTWTVRNTYTYSNNVSGSSEQNLTSRNHTIAIYTTDWSGNVRVEGNLDDTASSNDDDWFVIPIQGMSGTETEFTDESGINPYQFSSSIRWIRVRWKSATGNTGTFDQMLLRN